MSAMKNGFSTLNRWLGKKNKEKNLPNGKLSKSTTNLNLSVSSTNINETSQLEYNRITPLPVATSNAPFEQTFRITVLLPKDQLYVARLGARVPLRKLLELVCENKQLDTQKYEFRNPVDLSQTYSCDLTIGAVGLSEVRLCHKSEAYDNFNTDEVMKLHRTSIARDSLSSSEFSSRHSKNTMKTASPYSSTNSLNSTDSTGISYSRSPIGVGSGGGGGGGGMLSIISNTNTPTKILAPPRKKRAAPRPPSQCVIPERSALITDNANQSSKPERNANQLPKTEINGNQLHKPVPNGDLALNGVMPCETSKTKGDFCVVPQHFEILSNTHISKNTSLVDCNRNFEKSHLQNGQEALEANDSPLNNNVDVEEKNARNLCKTDNGSSTLSLSMDVMPQKIPEPSPRRRIAQIKKKTAPAPPPRFSACFNEAVTTTVAPEQTHKSQELQTTCLDQLQIQRSPSHSSNSWVSSSSEMNKNPPEMESSNKSETSENKSIPSTSTNEQEPPIATITSAIPKPVPRITSATIVTNNDQVHDEIVPASNVSKIMLNRTPTPEPRCLPTETSPIEISPTIGEVTNSNLLNHNDKNNSVSNIDDDDNCSKQADSGIGEPVPSPVPDSLPSDGSALDGKLSTFESSSDDDDMVKVYNFKLGKTLVQQQQIEQDELPGAPAEEVGCTIDTTSQPNSLSVDSVDTSLGATESSSWNLQVPISPPPNFADKNKPPELFKETSGVPTSSKIKEQAGQKLEVNLNAVKAAEEERRIVTDEAVIKAKEEATTQRVVEHPGPAKSPTSPMNEILDELHGILNEQRIESLIKKPKEGAHEIEAVKPSLLPNFSISSRSTRPTQHTVSTTKATCNGFIENSLVQSSPPPSPENVSDEDKIYRKRITHFTNSTAIALKQRRSINRADSCYATMQHPLNSFTQKSTAEPHQQQEGLNSRCSSYLSLNKFDQDVPSLQHRRSSSEVSIGESPSLQSLEIIKTILNARKENVKNGCINGEAKSTMDSSLRDLSTKNNESAENITQKPKPKNTFQSNLLKAEVRPSEFSESTKKAEQDLSKAYRYSGPPSINFSTWNERPKVQVAIKNEGDYIFGGKKAANQINAVTSVTMEISNSTPMRNYRNSTPAEDFRDFKLRTLKNSEQRRKSLKQESATNQTKSLKTVEYNEAKPTAIMRMGIAEKPYRVPTIVKPIQDDLELRDPQDNKVKLLINSNKMVKGCTENTPDVIPDSTIRILPQSITATPSTLPRNVGSTRFSMPSTTSALLRSTSITQLEKNQPKDRNSMLETPTATPFGQITLRKTGFKEKILAQETTTAPVNERNNQNLKGPEETLIRTPTNQIKHNFQQNSPEVLEEKSIHLQRFKENSPLKSLQCAKLELKLERPNGNLTDFSLTNSKETIRETDNNSIMVKPSSIPFSKLNGGNRKLSYRHVSENVEPTESTRDQLLEAIRNFKRETLNRP